VRPTSTRERGVIPAAPTPVAGLPDTGSGFSLSPSSGQAFYRSLLVIALIIGALLIIAQTVLHLPGGRGPTLRPGQSLLVRVTPLHSFSAFIEALSALRRAAGIDRAQAVRQQHGEGWFRVTLSAPATLEQVPRAVRRAVQRGVRISRSR
jgi:hypothetical protein